MVGYLDCDIVLLSVLVQYDVIHNVRHVRAQGELSYHLIEVPWLNVSRGWTPILRSSTSSIYLQILVKNTFSC